MVVKVNAMGDACPIPVVKTKNAVRGLGGSGTVEVLVDNEAAVQNITRMANHQGYGVKSERLSEREFQIILTVGEDAPAPAADEPVFCPVPAASKKVVVAVTSDTMGSGSGELGKILIKGFLFALTQQDALPSTILFYNGGAALTTEGSASLEDLKSLEAQGVEILTCGTCLNHYGLSEKLRVGGVTNMYDIVEKLTTADLVVRP